MKSVQGGGGFSSGHKWGILGGRQGAGKYNAAMSMLMGSDILLAAEHQKEFESDRAFINHGLSTLAETVAFAYQEILKCARKELGENIQ